MHTYIPSLVRREEETWTIHVFVFCTLPPSHEQVEAKTKKRAWSTSVRKVMNIAHFYLEGTCTYRYFYLLDIYHLQFKLASSRWLCRTLCNLPKQKVTFVCSFVFSPRGSHATSSSHAGYYGRILLLGRRNALGTFVMGWRRCGRWRNASFVGGERASSVCCEYVQVAFCCFSGCLARSWVCCFACIFALLCSLLYRLPAGWLAWKGLLEVYGVLWLVCCRMRYLCKSSE